MVLVALESMGVDSHKLGMSKRLTGGKNKPEQSLHDKHLHFKGHKRKVRGRASLHIHSPQLE